MGKIYESFFISGRKVGGIVRQLEQGSLSTLTSFQVPEGTMIHLEHRFYFRRSPFEWERYVFDEYHEGRHTEVERRKSILYDRDLALIQQVSDKTLPSYATFLLLSKMANEGVNRIELDLLTDGDPTHDSKASVLETNQSVSVQLPNHQVVSAMHVPLITEGKVGNQYWIANGRILKSDWQGAQSFAAENLADVLDGLGSHVAEIIASFI